MKSALHGAIRIASASRPRLMCAMLFASRRSHCELNTGRLLKACIVTGVMNRSAAAVMMTCTVAPSLTRARHNSAAL